MKQVSLVLIVSLMLLAPAACGGGNGESVKGLYIEKGDAICRSFRDEHGDQEEELARIAESGDFEIPAQETRFSGLLGKLVVAGQEEGKEIKALEPPGGDQDIVDRWLEGAERANALFGEANEALEAGELSEFVRLFKEGADLSQASHAAAQGYGFEICGNEAP
ncbi:MAG TPA: hypothetical protein VGC32_17550 [Solirubrobacterales bacterium]